MVSSDSFAAVFPAVDGASDLVKFKYPATAIIIASDVIAI